MFLFVYRVTKEDFPVPLFDLLLGLTKERGDDSGNTFLFFKRCGHGGLRNSCLCHDLALNFVMSRKWTHW